MNEKAAGQVGVVILVIALLCLGVFGLMYAGSKKAYQTPAPTKGEVATASKYLKKAVAPVAIDKQPTTKAIILRRQFASNIGWEEPTKWKLPTSSATLLLPGGKVVTVEDPLQVRLDPSDHYWDIPVGAYVALVLKDGEIGVDNMATVAPRDMRVQVRTAVRIDGK